MSNVQLIMMKIGFKILIIDTLGANARKEGISELGYSFHSADIFGKSRISP